MDKGWIKLNRQIQEHWIWNDPEKLKAWLDILLLANHEAKKVGMREGLITIRRGQFITSIGKLADRWKWSRERVRRYLKLLERDGMITRKSDTFKTTITVVNYGKFQGERHTFETSDETPNKSSNETSDKTRTRKNKNDKEIKEAAPPISDEMAAAQEEEKSEFIDGFVPMTDEEWESLPPL